MSDNNPLWLPNEQMAYWDNFDFAVIIIDDLYFPIGRFTGHLTTSGFCELEKAKSYHSFYYGN